MLLRLLVTQTWSAIEYGVTSEQSCSVSLAEIAGIRIRNGTRPDFAEDKANPSDYSNAVVRNIQWTCSTASTIYFKEGDAGMQEKSLVSGAILYRLEVMIWAACKNVPTGRAPL
jgi:hypothetical protein